MHSKAVRINAKTADRVFRKAEAQNRGILLLKSHRSKLVYRLVVSDKGPFSSSVWDFDAVRQIIPGTTAYDLKEPWFAPPPAA